MESAHKQKEDVDVLLKAGIPLALSLLKGKGHFEPFSCVLKHGGSVENVEQDESPVENDRAADLEKRCQELARKGDLAAIALFVHASVFSSNSTGSWEYNVISVDVEHRAGYSVTVTYPYSVSPEGVQTGTGMVENRRCRLFE